MVKDSRCEGRVVIVTGAGAGLGRAYALHLASLGWRVVVNNRNRSSSADAVVAEIHASGGEAIAQYDDVCSEGAGARMLQAALDTWGRLDALVNNAGVDQHAPFHKISLEDFKRIFAINFEGTVAITHAIYPHLRAQGAGRIVVSVSSAGLHGLHGLSAYAASKAALIAFMRSLAAEAAPRGVLVSAIAPYAATRMTDAHLTDELRERMSPESVAPFLAGLIHPDATSQGQTWVVGAGWARRASSVECGEGHAVPAASTPVTTPAGGVASSPPREFPDALAAHADFLVCAQQGLHRIGGRE
ncbi:MAG: SDR family NAD(P)-dependent oxidoreductase [Acidibacter sp.]|jgi:NAD(P)-dependent dehydrogenase (short-subunit alcohol dehydrogenase family)|nr:SDR family NAD(P)-dependent oxidoreductase [Acidibacter sp.]